MEVFIYPRRHRPAKVHQRSSTARFHSVSILLIHSRKNTSEKIRVGNVTEAYHACPMTGRCMFRALNIWILILRQIGKFWPKWLNRQQNSKDELKGGVYTITIWSWKDVRVSAAFCWVSVNKTLNAEKTDRSIHKLYISDGNLWNNSRSHVWFELHVIK